MGPNHVEVNFRCLAGPLQPYQTIPNHTKQYQTIPNHTKPYQTIPYHCDCKPFSAFFKYVLKPGPVTNDQCTMGKCTGGGRLRKWSFQRLLYYLEKPWFVNQPQLASIDSPLLLSFIFLIGRGQSWSPKFPLCNDQWPDPCPIN